MPRIAYGEENKYQNDKNGSWFSLPDDGDVARVQFLFENLEGIPIFAVHKVQVGEKDRYVNCLRNYNDPIDMCPLCASGIKVQVVRFVLMYDHADHEVKMWERGTTFITRLQGLMNRYNQDPFPYYVFEIERHGRKGDPKTKYEVYPMDRVEPYDVSEVELPQLLGGLIIDADADGMNQYLDTGMFPREEDESYQPPQQPNRRVPANQAAGVARRNATPTPPVTRREPVAAPQTDAQPVDATSKRAPAVPPRRGGTERF